MGTFDGVEFCVEIGMDYASLMEYPGIVLNNPSMNTYTFRNRFSPAIEVIKADTFSEARRALEAKWPYSFDEYYEDREDPILRKAVNGCLNRDLAH